MRPIGQIERRVDNQHTLQRTDWLDYIQKEKSLVRPSGPHSRNDWDLLSANSEVIGEFNWHERLAKPTDSFGQGVALVFGDERFISEVTSCAKKVAAGLHANFHPCKQEISKISDLLRENKVEFLIRFRGQKELRKIKLFSVGPYNGGSLRMSDADSPKLINASFESIESMFWIGDPDYDMVSDSNK